MNNKSPLKQIKAQRLTESRKKTGLSRTSFASQNRINYNTYKAHESGQREFFTADAARYAKALGVPINHLLALDLIDSTFKTILPQEEMPGAVLTVPVYGQAAGGLWLEGDDVPFDDEPVYISPAADYPPQSQYARKVVGNSVSNHIRDGEFAIFVRYGEYPYSLRPGMLVDCMRQRAGMYEHSVKVFAGDKLMTDSAELSSQTAIPLGHTDDDTTVTIEGVAVGVYRHLPLGAKRTEAA